MALGAIVTLAALGFVGGGLGLVLWLGAARWEGKTCQLVAKLTTGEEVEMVAFDTFERLPTPVAKYFRWALKVGEFRTRDADEAWSRFEAKQYISTRPPGFVWDASIRMAPLVQVRVRDAYVAGQGSVQGKILSLVPVVDEYGKAELNAGALQRYLAEAIWFPTALLPSQGVTWQAIDSSKALATLTDSGTTVSVEFHFNDIGAITGVVTSGRYREVNGQYELTPWAGQFRHYEERHGMRIPVAGEVAWQLPGGSFPYWKGRIVEVEYDFAP